MFFAGKFGRMPPLDAVLPRVGAMQDEVKEYKADRINPAVVASSADERRPQFTMRAKGVEGYVGSAWLNEGKFGKYISVRLRGQVGPSATIYISPTRENADIL